MIDTAVQRDIEDAAAFRDQRPRRRVDGGSRFMGGFVVLLAGSLLGKIAGLVREVVFAAAFGSGVIATGFKTAQSAVLVTANLVTGDLLSSAFVPTYARIRVEDKEQARRLLWAYLLSYGLVMSAASLALFLMRHVAMNVIIPGASVAVRLLAGDFLGTLAWCIPLLCLTGIASCALATEGLYRATSLRATLQTFGLLIGTVFAVVLRSPLWLAAGFVLAWLVYTVWCVALLSRFDLLGRPDPRSVLRAMRLVLHNLYSVLPLAAIPVGVQISIVLQRVIASHGPSELIASVDYAQTLSDSLVTLVSVPLGFVGLTRFATVTEGQFMSALRRIQTLVIALGMPAAFVLLPLTGTVVELVFRRGSFDAHTAALTSQVAFGMFCGLAVQILGYTLTRALTARRRNRSVLWITLSALAAQMGTQLLSLPFHAPVLIGFGLTVYGLVLTVLCVGQLGLGRSFARLVVSGAPAAAVSIAVLLLPFPPLLASAVVLLAWTTNVALAPALRGALMGVRNEVARVVRRRSRPVVPATPRT